MRWLIGLIAGLIVGGMGWGWSGAVVLGFIGWLAGVIAGSKKSAAPVTPQRTMVEAPSTRMERLERSVAALERRLARLEGSPVGDVPPVTTEAIESAQAGATEASAPTEAAAPTEAPVEAAAPPRQPPRVSPPPRPPPKPNFIIAWFMGGNTIVRVGALILFVGLVFLVNYAREHNLIAPEFRVAGVAAFGIALLVIGWRLREKRTGYAVSLQGAGVATLYLTMFAAMRLYHLVSPEAAFFLLAAIAAFSAVLAIGQDSLALAVIGAGGGFLAPILASTGGGNHVALFSYYLVLNAGIFGIAWYKAWRSLNVMGLLFTFLIGLAWGTQSYTDEKFATTEPFLIAFFLMYVAIAILFTRGSSSTIPPRAEKSSSTLPSGSNGRGSRFVDGTVVFGTPHKAFGLQAGMLADTEFGLAYTSIASAALYMALAFILMRQRNERWSLLNESFLALGVVFATLAIPLALDARWTSASWALEGAAIVWLGVRQQRTLARAFGLLLQVGAAVSYLIAYGGMPDGPPLVDAPFIGALLMAIAGLAVHRLLAMGGDRVTKVEKGLVPIFFVWGIAWLIFAGHHEIETFLPQEMRLNAHALLLAAIALAFTLIARSGKWSEARWPGYALLPGLMLVALLEFLRQSHPFADYGALAWPAAFAVLVYVLHESDKRQVNGEGISVLHAGTFLLASALGAWEMHWAAVLVTAHGTAWSVTSVLLAPAMLLLFAVSREVDERWPVKAHVQAYRLGAVLPVLVAMGAWVLYANGTHDGTSTPLPYLPLLNAIDLGHALIAICVAGAVFAWRRSEIDIPEPFRGRAGWAVVGALTFVWLNGVLLRSLHHWADVPYRLQPMMRSVIVQASISVFWSVIALGLMVYATRHARRALWMVGAALMGVVVVKLFLLDFSHLAGIERIVSFIVVGILMLVIGYFSPVPPRMREEPA